MCHWPRLDHMAFLNQYLPRGMDYPQPRVAFPELEWSHFTGDHRSCWEAGPRLCSGRMLGGPALVGGVRKGMVILGEQECDEESVCLISKLLPPSLCFPKSLCSIEGPCPHPLLIPGALWHSYPLLPHDLLPAGTSIL